MQDTQQRRRADFNVNHREMCLLPLPHSLFVLKALAAIEQVPLQHAVKATTLSTGAAAYADHMCTVKVVDCCACMNDAPPITLLYY